MVGYMSLNILWVVTVTKTMVCLINSKFKGKFDEQKEHNLGCQTASGVSRL